MHVHISTIMQKHNLALEIKIISNKYSSILWESNLKCLVFFASILWNGHKLDIIFVASNNNLTRITGDAMHAYLICIYFLLILNYYSQYICIPQREDFRCALQTFFFLMFTFYWHSYDKVKKRYYTFFVENVFYPFSYIVYIYSFTFTYSCWRIVRARLLCW